MQIISGCWKLSNTILILLRRSLGLQSSHSMPWQQTPWDCWWVLLLVLDFFLAEDKHVEKRIPRVLSVHCCWQVESWSWCRTKMKLLSFWHETRETNVLLCWMNDAFLWHFIQIQSKSHIIHWKENACSHKASRAPKGVCLIISCGANGKIHKASHLL